MLNFGTRKMAHLFQFTVHLLTCYALVGRAPEAYGSRVCICVCVYMYVCVRVYVATHHMSIYPLSSHGFLVCMHVCVHMCVCVCVCVCVCCVCMCTCACVCPTSVGIVSVSHQYLKWYSHLAQYLTLCGCPVNLHGHFWWPFTQSTSGLHRYNLKMLCVSCGVNTLDAAKKIKNSAEAEVFSVKIFSVKYIR